MNLKNFRTYALAVELYGLCKEQCLPHYLKDQLLRAVSSIALNLAEGSAKPSDRDRRRFYAMAFGSLRETQALLAILRATKEANVADQIGACLYRLTNPRTRIGSGSPVDQIRTAAS